MTKTTLAALEKRVKTLERFQEDMQEIFHEAVDSLISTDDYWQFHNSLKEKLSIFKGEWAR